MAIQADPAVFGQLTGLQKTDAENLYANTPKRLLFDALYRVQVFPSTIARVTI